MGLMGQNSTTLYLEEFTRWQYELDVRQLEWLVEFGGSLLSTMPSSVCALVFPVLRYYWLHMPVAIPT